MTTIRHKATGQTLEGTAVAVGRIYGRGPMIHFWAVGDTLGTFFYEAEWEILPGPVGDTNT